MFNEIEGVVAICVLVPGLLLRRLPTPKTIQTNEAMLIVALAFLLAALMMIWPLISAGLNFPDAIFEAISGVTATGLTAIGSVQVNRPVFYLPGPGCKGTEGRV